MFSTPLVRLGAWLLACVAPAQAAAGTEILWDRYGVPHIFAENSSKLIYAFGWAQAQAHGDLLLTLIGEARGRAAEYWGQEHLQSDRWVRLNGIPARARDWYRAQPAEYRGYLDAFARGVNDYCARNQRAVAESRRAVLPVNGADLLAHYQRAIIFTFVTGRERVEGAVRSWEPAGSNTWAVAPRRTQNGKALLVQNPHLPWSHLYTWFEAQLAAPGLNAYGATLVGCPFLGIAFNDSLGWSHTVNTIDAADLYELSLEQGGYRFDGGVRRFETERQRIKVKGRDGRLREEELIIRRSVHGPVVAERGGKALALRVASLDAAGSLSQWWDMARARNLAEFETALQRLQLPMFTVMYADRDGHILHFFAGRIPVRKKGGWGFWSGIVPGDTSATLWTEVHRFEELPRALDPPSGWLQNANDPPWTTTFPAVFDPDRFPPYLAPRSMSFRAQRSARMLDENDRLTLEKLIELKHSTRMELADRILDDLERAVQTRGGAEARTAMQVLSQWDRSADAESRGAVLFEEFTRELSRRAGRKGPFAAAWNEREARTTPDGLADPAMAAAALEAAAAAVRARHGSLDVPWGQVYRLRAGGLDLPANGGPGNLGIFRVLVFEPAAGGRFVAGGGDSYVAAIEFSSPPRARALIAYGNASQPGSRHGGDQLELFARKQLRPVWRTREEIEKNLESRQKF